MHSLKNIIIDVEAEISSALTEMSMPTNIKGYRYLSTAIDIAVKDPEVINSVSTVLYPFIAEKYQTTASAVESAIRKAIDISWDRGDVDILNFYFGYTINSCRGRPTPSEYISQIADRISLKIENDPLKMQISNVLRQIGVPADINGYRYIRTSVELAVKDPDSIESETKDLYFSVAEKYQTTASSVESAIRKAINISWDRGDVDTLNAYFGCTIQNICEKPTPSKFIAMIADDLGPGLKKHNKSINPFVPNDKYDVAGLKECWNYIRENISIVETTYFRKLAAKTYDLFFEYATRDEIPKTFVDLLCVLGQFETVGEFEEYSAADIIKAVVKVLLQKLTCGYHHGERSEFIMVYCTDTYILDAKTFDITPVIKNINKEKAVDS